MIETGFFQFVQVVKGLADAFQSRKLFFMHSGFEETEMQVRLRDKLLR